MSPRAEIESVFAADEEIWRAKEKAGSFSILRLSPKHRGQKSGTRWKSTTTSQGTQFARTNTGKGIRDSNICNRYQSNYGKREAEKRLRNGLEMAECRGRMREILSYLYILELRLCSIKLKQFF